MCAKNLLIIKNKNTIYPLLFYEDLEFKNADYVEIYRYYYLLCWYSLYFWLKDQLIILNQRTKPQLKKIDRIKSIFYIKLSFNNPLKKLCLYSYLDCWYIIKYYLMCTKLCYNNNLNNYPNIIMTNNI